MALTVGLVLLHLRLSALDDLSDQQALALAVASTDPLTGALTRNGLLSLMPTLGAIAGREEEQVCVMSFRLHDLDRLVQQYGTRYGQDVVSEVAESVREHTRGGDLVARWDRGQFVVAGLGRQPSAETVAGRVQQGIVDSSVALGKWEPTVSVGTAAGDPQATTFDALLQQAEAAATVNR